MSFSMHCLYVILQRKSLRKKKFCQWVLDCLVYKVVQLHFYTRERKFWSLAPVQNTTHLRFPVRQSSVFEHKVSLPPRLDFSAQFGEIAGLFQGLFCIIKGFTWTTADGHCVLGGHQHSAGSWGKWCQGWWGCIWRDSVVIGHLRVEWSFCQNKQKFIRADPAVARTRHKLSSMHRISLLEWKQNKQYL